VCAVTVIAHGIIIQLFCGIIAYYQRSALLLLLLITYNELITLVEQLRKQVVEATVSSDANSGITDASVYSESSSRQPALDFRVLPDLDKTVGVFNGRESTHASADWLMSVEGIANLNCWPFAYRLQFVRGNVQGAVKDWFVGRTFKDWQDFRTQFNATFIRAVRMSDRWEALRRGTKRKTSIRWIISSRS